MMRKRIEEDRNYLYIIYVYFRMNKIKRIKIENSGMYGI